MIKGPNCFTGLAMCLLIGIVSITSLSAESLFIDVFAQNSNVKSNDAQFSKGAFSMQNIIISDAKGGFSSLQADSNNKVWITSGKWNLVSNPSKISPGNSSSVGFNATINMRGTDNITEHGHKVSDFKFAKGSIRSTNQGSIFTFNGTGTIETPQGVRPDVPISVRIIDKNPISLVMDDQAGRTMPQWVPGGGIIILSVDKSAQDHFGSTPVYGDVKGQ